MHTLYIKIYIVHNIYNSTLITLKYTPSTQQQLQFCDLWTTISLLLWLRVWWTIKYDVPIFTWLGTMFIFTIIFAHHISKILFFYHKLKHIEVEE